MSCIRIFFFAFFTIGCSSHAFGQSWSLAPNPKLEAYFDQQVSRLEAANELTQYKTLQDWQRDRPELRKQLFDMLGLDPLPEKTPLVPKLMGTTEHPEFIVERLHFQSMPGLYVTANLYLPREASESENVARQSSATSSQQSSQTYPTILYVCGHAKVEKDGVSYGNKAHYQHHGAWFARNGYVCLIIDTVQRGEIEGVHHGTYRLKRWWWNARGYTPAGLEAWNCMRALDYLESRNECDMTRVGVTGRSGGGIYSWWLMALDDRVHCGVPVAGITSMRDQVMRGCIEGHCDCMFMLNTYQWNFAKIAALAAPRPLLISNTDKDAIFPLEGVVDVHRQVRHIYRLHDAGDQLGLQITEGPHADTQELHIHAFRWFNRFLKGDQTTIETTAEKFFTPDLLKVFETLPTEQNNTNIDEQFVPAAEAITAQSILGRQETLLEEYRQRLLERCFRAWPTKLAGIAEVEVQSIELPEELGSERANPKSASSEQATQLTLIEFESEPLVPLRLDVHHRRSVSLNELESVNLVIDSKPSPPAMPEEFDAVARLVIRPGHQPWIADERKLTHIRRRFQLLGTTLESMQVWDIRCGLQLLRKQCPNLKKIRLTASDGTESLVLLASLFDSPAESLVVSSLPVSSESSPSILNLTRTMPIELLSVLAASRTPIVTADSATQHSLLHEVVNSEKWAGQNVRFDSRKKR